jgi:hypothetical protein
MFSGVRSTVRHSGATPAIARLTTLFPAATGGVCSAAPALVDAPRVFDGATFTFKDDRSSYGEQRFITLELLAGVPVSVVHTETEDEIRIISFRKATNCEALIFFNEVQH